jgi:hypothetical protein
VATQGVEVPALEFYPDSCARGVLGHAVRLPLGVHRKTGLRYPFFDEQGLPCTFTVIEKAAARRKKFGELKDECLIRFAEDLTSRKRKPRTARSPILDIAREFEADLVRDLKRGEGTVVGERARLIMKAIMDDTRLDGDLEAQRLLLRYGEISEAAQEVAGQWHGERTKRGELAILELLDYIGMRGSQVGIDEQYALLTARRAVLKRETFRDRVAGSKRVLGESNQYFAEALNHLRYGQSNPLLELVLECQRLHVRAVVGDRDWPMLLRELASRMKSHLSVDEQQLGEAIVAYFEAQGYKRLAWAMRAVRDQNDVQKRMDHLQRARDAFLGFRERERAWHIESEVFCSLIAAC